jgi:hypothetical protein
VTTAQQVFNITMAFADEIDDTSVINPTNTASYRVRTPGILTAIQAELIKIGNMYSTYEISNKPIANMLGLLNGMDYLEYLDTEITKEASGSVKAYYFEVDGEGTVYVEDYTNGWNILKTINVPDTVTNFTAFKGIVTPTAGATKSRLRFTGSYRYLITNYAMFSVPLQESKVPDFRPWIKKTMPSDFNSIDQIVNEYPQRQYTKDVAYKWEGANELWINYFYEGNIRIKYRPVPLPITSITQTLQVDDVTANTLLPYALGAELFKEENEDIYKHFIQRYRELKALSMIGKPVSEQAIVDVYSLVR